MQLVADYVFANGLPVRCRPLWIARDLEDEHGKDRLSELKSTQTLKTSVQLCYVNEGVGGGKVWIREDCLLAPMAAV